MAAVTSASSAPRAMAWSRRSRSGGPPPAFAKRVEASQDLGRHASPPSATASAPRRDTAAAADARTGGSTTLLPPSRLAVVAAQRPAVATFDGLVYMRTTRTRSSKRSSDETEEHEGRHNVYEVFSASAEATPKLQEELITSAERARGPYRLSRRCPEYEYARDDVASEDASASNPAGVSASACCVAASSTATAELWLWPLLQGLASGGGGEGGDEHFDTHFLEGLGTQVTDRLLECEAVSHG